MTDKYTSYITVLECWNTAARKHPTAYENDPHCKKKKFKTTSLNPVLKRRKCRHPIYGCDEYKPVTMKFCVTPPSESTDVLQRMSLTEHRTAACAANTNDWIVCQLRHR